MTFLWIVSLVEFSIAVIFYVQMKRAWRDIDALSADNAALEHLLADSDDDAECVCRCEPMLGTINQNLEKLMSSFEDAKAAQAVTDAKIDAVKADVEALVAKLAAVPASGMSADQQAALDDIVAHANAINDKLSAVNAEVNPPAAPAPVADPAAPAAQ